MTDKEYLDLMIEERIAVLLQTKMEEREKEMMGDASKTIEGLDEEVRLQVETCMNLLIDKMADSEVKLYMGGFKDGVKLTKWVERL